MILPRASCRKHEKLTSRIETKVLHAMFDPLRKQHDIRNRSKKPLLKGNFDVSHMVDGKNVTLRLPIADHPTILVLHRLGAPGILSGRPKWLHGIIGWWLVNINADAASLRKHGLSSFASPPIDTVLFSMMLAKIAHAFACAEVRIENFDPLLLDFLLNPPEATEVDNRRYHFFGGDPGIEAPSTYLHEIGIGTYELASDMYLVVRIRLLAYLGAPAYFVVVGTIPSTKRAAVIARLSANNPQT